MAPTVNWITKVISVPKSDLTLIGPGELYELDINTFRLDLKAIEADEGMPFVDTHRHNTEVTVAGVTLARVVEIINGYTVTFEDGQYAVNLVGANSNIGDVTNVNQVSIRPQNSAGLITVGGANPSVIAGAVWDEPLADHLTAGTAGKALDDAKDSGTSPTAIADAVLEELVSDHQSVSGSLAEAIMLIKGLAQDNYVLDSTSFNANGLMTAATIRIFSNATQVANATDGGTGQGELATFTVTAEAEPGQGDRLKLYKVSRS